jgi:formylglycine-generating enzyme required for sulfatase activity
MNRTFIGILLIACLLPPLAATRAAEGDAKSEAEMKGYKERLGKHLEFVPIKGGKFMMGSPKDETGRKDDEGPQFEVEIEPFWMGKYEVTWDDFQAFRDEYEVDIKKRKPIPADREADAVSIPTQTWEQEFRPILNPLGDKGGYPVADLSRLNAMQFTKWLSIKTGRFYRLPTEAEWEYAARADRKTAYFWGPKPDSLNRVAWFFDNSERENPEKNGYPKNEDPYTAGYGYRQVGKLEPNPWGLHDMYGNVSEWVIDGYDKNWYARFQGKSVSWKDAINWPSEGTFPTVYRGGDFTAVPEACRSASRAASNKELQVKDPNKPPSPWWYSNAFHIGFRVIRPLKEPSEEEKHKFWDSALNLKEAKAVYDSEDSRNKQFRKVIDPLKSE